MSAHAWAQVGLGLASATFLLAGASDWATRQEKGGRWQTVARTTPVGGFALLVFGLVLRGLAANIWPLASWADRAIVLALVPGSISFVQSLTGKNTWIGLGLAPTALLVALGAFGRVSEATTQAPALVLFCLATAGLMVWTAGRAIVASLGLDTGDTRAFKLAFAGSTLALAASSLLNWRVWGTPTGDSAATASLAAAWLVGAARLVMGDESKRLGYGLDILAGAVLTLVGLFVQWSLV